jgi:hypothetical protein
VHIVGYRHDGTTVTTDVETGGINFHTVYFSPSFTGLDRVEIPNYGWSLDNQRYNARAPATASGFTKPVTPSSEPERL